MARLQWGQKDPEAPSAPWATALNTAKLLAWLLVASIAGNVAQAVALTTLFYKKEKVPVIVEFREPGQNFVVVEKADGKVRGNKRLIAMFLKRYVVDRETVDKQTELDIRYPRVQAMSDGGVFQSFKAAYGPPHGLYYKEGLKRQVKIARDSVLSDGIHQIEFETRDFIEGRPGDMQDAEPVKTEWVATITYDFSDKQVKANEAALDFNPMGLVITEYTIARRQ